MTRSLVLLSATVLLTSACQGGGNSANTTADGNAAVSVDASADEQAIRAQVDRWHKLMKDKDAAGIAALYSDDGAVMPPNAPIAKGAAAIQPVWASLLQIPGFELKIIPDQITVSASGDLALDRGHYELTVAPDGAAKTDKGKYVVVWRKVDGEWKAAADIFNSDLPAG